MYFIRKCIYSRFSHMTTSKFFFFSIIKKSPESLLGLDDSEFKKSTHISAELKRRQNIKVTTHLSHRVRKMYHMTCTQRRLGSAFVSVQPNQGQVVQSIVSLTSSLRVLSPTVLVESIYNILIFFAEKM